MKRSWFREELEEEEGPHLKAHQCDACGDHARGWWGFGQQNWVAAVAAVVPLEQVMPDDWALQHRFCSPLWKQLVAGANVLVVAVVRGSDVRVWPSSRIVAGAILQE